MVVLSRERWWREERERERVCVCVLRSREMYTCCSSNVFPLSFFYMEKKDNEEIAVCHEEQPTFAVLTLLNPLLRTQKRHDIDLSFPLKDSHRRTQSVFRTRAGFFFFSFFFFVTIIHLTNGLTDLFVCILCLSGTWCPLLFKVSSVSQCIIVQAWHCSPDSRLFLFDS